MKLHVIASGSKGNASIVENATTGEGILIDCGISKKALFAGCEEVSFDRKKISAVLVTHDHSDHTKGLGVAMRGLFKEGAHPELFANSKVIDVSSDVRDAVKNASVKNLVCDEGFVVAGISVLPFETSHDAAFSCGFRFDLDGDTIGFMTDSGVVTGYAHEALQGARVLALESNHDLDMLARGPYPVYVQRRISSERGHLSNVQAEEELRALLSDNLREVVAMHVSQNCNTYKMALDACKNVVEREGLANVVGVRTAYQQRSVSV